MPPVTGACGADELANALTVSLTDGENFDLPVIDVSGPEFTIQVDTDLDIPVVHLTNADLTTKVVDGTGTFDNLMMGVKIHLKEEFDRGRITGEQYAKVYMGLTESVIGNSVQFLLGRDQAYWQAVTARLQAQVAQASVVTARVQLEIAKMELQKVRLELARTKAEYALTKMKVSTESITYCSAKYTLENLMPANLAMIREQIEAARAQTLNTRSDGTLVVGLLGKQKDLYTQQITSYQRDSEYKVAKLFTDAWAVQKTIDEGLLAPVGFTNASLDTVLTKLKINNGLT